jgi:hypothetical protein
MRVRPDGSLLSWSVMAASFALIPNPFPAKGKGVPLSLWERG